MLTVAVSLPQQLACLSCSERDGIRSWWGNTPALHSGLKPDHVLKGLPALGSPGLVGLEGSLNGWYQLH